MELLKGAAIVGQSGGPTAAINATLAGVVRGVLGASGTITKLYGMRNGIEGFLADRLIDLGEIFAGENGGADEDKLALLTQTPGAALGSCRRKLPDPDLEPEFYESMIERFREKDIRYFFYIGGNDSMDTAEKLSRYMAHSDWEIRVIGLPKTVDNDLPVTDHAPGYGSAAKVIATEVQEIIRDCAVYVVPAVTIVEIMGRDAGWMTAATALGRAAGGHAPDLVYLPEVDFSMEQFMTDVRTLFSRKPNLVIAVSEGIHFADGTYVGETDQNHVTDVFGHRYLAGAGKTLERAVKEAFGCKVRAVELSLPQRCSAHCASLTDLTESAAAGKAGVEAALRGETARMVTILRKPGGEYGVTYGTVPLSEIANCERRVPLEFINPDGNNVTDECLRYLLPLIQGEPEIIRRNGLPAHFVFD